MNKQEGDDKSKQSLSGKFKQFVATICIGPITLGSSIVWTSPVLPQLLKAKSDTHLTNSTAFTEFINENSSNASLQLTLEEGSWVGSMLAIGSLTAAIPAGFLADYFGPRRCILCFVIPVVVFTLFTIFSEDAITLCVGRFFSGIATGGISVVAPMYISEIAHVSIRGTLSSFFELLIFVGVVLTAVLGAVLHYVTLTLTIGGFTLVVGVLFLMFPESPTYLMKTDRREKAEKALLFYRGEDFDVGEALDEISNGLDRKNQQNGKKTVRELLSSKAAKRGLIACVGLTSFQQLSGIDGILCYTVFIFKEAGTSLDAYTSSIIVSVVELISAAVVVLIVERFDRKIFLYISSVGTCVCLALFGLYFTLKDYGILGIGLLPLVSMIFYMVSFAMGLGPVPWMVNGELFSSEIKGFANGITIATNWILLFVVTKTLPMMITEWGAHYTFYTYSVFMVLCTLFIKFCVPETRGKTLEQIQQELSK